MAARALDLPVRLAALDDVVELARGRIDDALVWQARDVQSRAAERLSRGSQVVVVALAGGTGSGKSSLFNALAGSDLAQTGPVRPVTDRPMAWAVGDPDAATVLLDWLGVRRRFHTDSAPGIPPGLVLLDLPDHDSIVGGHRETVERFVERVDVLVWVVDPLKYAQRTLHADFLARMAAHAEVLLVVLNRIDDLPGGSRGPVLGDLRRRLDQDGLHKAEILATSARTGEGVEALRERIARFVQRRRAVGDRIAADLATVAAAVAPHVGAPRAAALPAGQLVSALSRAVGVDDLAASAAAAYREDADDATRPLLTGAVLRRLRRVRLQLRRARLRPAVARHVDVREPTSLEVRHALSEMAGGAAAGLPHPWPARLQAAAAQLADDLPVPLAKAVDAVELHDVGRRRWWLPLRLLGTLLEGAAVAGLAWLTLLAVLDYLRISFAEPPAVGRLPWPTLLLIAGTVGLLGLSVVRRRAAAVGARRHALRVRKRLRAAVEGVAAQRAVGPVREELSAHDRLAAAVAALRP